MCNESEYCRYIILGSPNTTITPSYSTSSLIARVPLKSNSHNKQHICLYLNFVVIVGGGGGGSAGGSGSVGWWLLSFLWTRVMDSAFYLMFNFQNVNCI